jgi:hypothetical protein
LADTLRSLATAIGSLIVSRKPMSSKAKIAVTEAASLITIVVVELVGSVTGIRSWGVWVLYVPDVTASPALPAGVPVRRNVGRAIGLTPVNA